MDSYYGTARLTDCTISGNSALDNGGGLEVYGGTAALAECTVSANAAGSGGGLNNAFGTVTLTSTIVAGDRAGGDVVGTHSGADNFVGGNPLLAPLSYYGGSTQTMPPLPGSPVIAAGIDGSGTATIDQRGEPRPVTGAFDIGSVQTEGYTLTAAGTPQATPSGSAFAKPLTVTVTAKDRLDPVNGGVITFTAPASGASAALSSVSAEIVSGSAFHEGHRRFHGGQLHRHRRRPGIAVAASFSLTNVGTAPTSSVDPSLLRQTVTFTAAVFVAPGSSPTGSVTFYDGSTRLATVSLGGGKATYSTYTLALGTHAIKAVYSGDSTHASSTSPVLDQVVYTRAPIRPLATPDDATAAGRVMFTGVVASSATPGAVRRRSARRAGVGRHGRRVAGAGDGGDAGAHPGRPGASRRPGHRRHPRPWPGRARPIADPGGEDRDQGARALAIAATSPRACARHVAGVIRARDRGFVGWRSEHRPGPAPVLERIRPATPCNRR